MPDTGSMPIGTASKYPAFLFANRAVNHTGVFSFKVKSPSTSLPLSYILL